jgi:hypothetical protein
MPDMQKLTTIALFLLFSLSLYSQDSGTSQASLDGLWMGKMKVSEQMSLQIAFEIDLKDGGHYSAKMNVIEQRALDIPMDTCVFKKDSLYIELRKLALITRVFILVWRIRFMESILREVACFPWIWFGWTICPWR